MSVLLAVKKSRRRFQLFDVSSKRFDFHSFTADAHELFARASHTNPAIIESRVGKVIGKSKVTVGHEPVFSGLVLNSLRHFKLRFHRNQSVFKDRKLTAPVNRQYKCFAARIHSLLFVGTNSEEYTVIFAFGSLHQIGMTGPVDHILPVIRQVSLRQNGVIGCRHIRAFG
ncbi:hypothetical protein SDC9_152096 [bioreactor metagenome]|uniref:Uncharacterized protein n=1 Tax=bioreactor metagenome TaxID=1076179 RepID=A0A645ES54_9ZZZZ